MWSFTLINLSPRKILASSNWHLGLNYEEPRSISLALQLVYTSIRSKFVVFVN